MAVNLPITRVDGTRYPWKFGNYGDIETGNRTEFYSAADNSATSYYSSTNVQLELGGRQIHYGPDTSDDVSISRKVYVSPKEGFVRYLEIFTNTGGTATTESFTISSRLQSTPTVTRTSDGDTSFSIADDWLVQDTPGDTRAAVTHVLGGAYGIDPVSTYNSFGSVNYEYEFDLAPGETKIIMHFVALDANPVQGMAQARSLSALRGDALTGLTALELDSIVNFVPLETVRLNLRGTARPDTLVADRYDETIDALAGNDFVYADNGDDRVFGRAGNDTLLGGDGDDRISGGYGHDLVYGGNGDDHISGDEDSFVTTTATGRVPSTREQLSVSMTLPDAAAGRSVPITGFVSRTPVTSNEFNVAFVIDVSGSTTSTFSGNVAVGDRNGDGSANTVLDAEIVGFEALLGGITRQVGAENLNLAVIPFETDARTVFSANAARDSNVNGLTDAVEALRSLRSTGGTDFESGLQEAVRFFRGQSGGQNLVFFLSDGFDGGSTFNDEVAALRQPNGINATIRSFGVGSGASKTDLDLVDDGRNNNTTEIVLDPSRLSRVLIDPGISKTDVLRVDLLVNGKVAKSIPGGQLQESPLGLSFSFGTTLNGLQPNASDTIIARVIGSDPARTTIATRQVVEVLRDSPGNDRLFGGNGQDDIRAGAGNDLVHGNNGNDLIYGENGNDRLNGDRGRDLLFGGPGNDLLVGGLGVDRAVGGAGNDLYIVDRAGDLVQEVAGGGTDTVRALANFRLPNNVENLVLVGNAKIGTGNTANNSITGNAGPNSLDGGAGNDLLRGGAGNDGIIGGPGNDRLFGDFGQDVLVGGPGSDSFCFTTRAVPANLDRIRDFNVAQDTLVFDNAAFAALGPARALPAAYFHRGAAAHDDNDRIVYDPRNGNLWYDANGDDPGGQALVAKLAAGLALTAADVLVV